MIWGRGAVDMLNLTATMAVAFRHLADVRLQARRARSSTSPSPTRRPCGIWGADRLVDHELDDVQADYVITESGGFQVPTAERPPPPGDRRGEGHVLVPAHGAGHAGPRVAAVPHRQRARDRGRGRAPARRVPAAAEINDTWQRLVEGVGLAASCEPLLDAEALPRLLEQLPLGLARIAHACTHTTFAPTVVHGGTKTNVIPDRVDIEVDIRTLPGQTGDDVAGDARATRSATSPTRSRSAFDDDRVDRVADRHAAVGRAGRVTARLVRGLALGAVAHGRRDRRPLLPPRRLGRLRLRPVQPRLSFEDYASMFHGNDERVDQESCVSRPSCGSRSPRISSAERREPAARYWRPGRAGTLERVGQRRRSGPPSTRDPPARRLLLERPDVLARSRRPRPRLVHPPAPGAGEHVQLAQVQGSAVTIRGVRAAPACERVRG